MQPWFIQRSGCRGWFTVIYNNSTYTWRSAGQSGTNFTLTCTIGWELRGKAHLNNSVQNRPLTYHTSVYADSVLLPARIQQHAWVHRLKNHAASAPMLCKRVQSSPSFAFSCRGGWYLLNMWQSTWEQFVHWPFWILQSVTATEPQGGGDFVTLNAQRCTRTHRLWTGWKEDGAYVKGVHRVLLTHMQMFTCRPDHEETQIHPNINMNSFSALQWFSGVMI